MKKSLVRWITTLPILGALAGVLLSRNQSSSNRGLVPPAKPVKRIGTNFVITHAQWLNGEWGGPPQGKVGPAWKESLVRSLKLGLKLVRIPAQWDQVDQPKGRQNLKDAIELCRRYGASVILCVGLKTPHWPEVHLPDRYKALAVTSAPGIGPEELNTTNPDIHQAALQYLRDILAEYGADPIIVAIQIENEPLEAFGEPKRSVPFAFLKEEVELARTLTKKPLIVTMGAGLTGNLAAMKAERQQMLNLLLTLPVDRIGLDIYQRGFVEYKVFGLKFVTEFNAGSEHWQIAKQFIDQIRASGKVPFIAELQSEPWEARGEDVDYKDPNGNRSFTPAALKEIFARATQLGCDDILLWGREFHVACEEQGNPAWTETVKEILQNNLKK